MRFNLRTGCRGLPSALSALSTVPGTGGDGNGLLELRVDRGDCGVSDDGDMDEIYVGPAVLLVYYSYPSQ
jgi:hypothetical protein